MPKFHIIQRQLLKQKLAALYLLIFQAIYIIQFWIDGFSKLQNQVRRKMCMYPFEWMIYNSNLKNWLILMKCSLLVQIFWQYQQKFGKIDTFLVKVLNCTDLVAKCGQEWFIFFAKNSVKKRSHIKHFSSDSGDKIIIRGYP